MKALILLIPLLLVSCAIPIPDNDFIEGTAGFYKPTSPIDPSGKLGVFFSRPEKAVISEK